MSFRNRVGRTFGKLLNTNAVEHATQQEIAQKADTSNLANIESEFESGDLKDRIPFRANRTIPNFRYAYKYDSTVNSVINNLVVVANTKYEILPETIEFEEEAKYIQDKCKEWKISKYVEKFIKRNMVDGAMFTNRYVENGSVKFRILANDGKDFKWKVLRDPTTEEIVGYKQSVRKTKLPKDWKGAEYDNVVNVEEEITTITFKPEEIIYSTYMEEDGKGVSALYAILDTVDKKGKLERYMLLSGHKSGGFLGLQVGNDRVDGASIDNTFINMVMDWFSSNSDKDVVAYPDGIEPKLVGGQSLSEAYVSYLNYLKSEIRNGILTPDSKFSAVSSNRATATEQLNTSTGYQGFIEWLQEYICEYINSEIIDKELELKFPKAVGKIKLVYNNEELEDEATLSDTGTKIKNLFPDLNAELVIRTYFPRFARMMDKYKRLYGEKWEEKLNAKLGVPDMPVDGTAGASGGNLWSKPGMNTWNENQHNNAVKQKKKSQENNTGDKNIYKEV